MEQWDELHQKEQGLLEKEERLNKEIKQVRKIKELYEAHFHESGDFISELHYTFYKNDGNYIYESIRDDYLKESRKIMNGLDEDEEALFSAKKKLQQQLDECEHEKKVALTEEVKYEH